MGSSIDSSRRVLAKIPSQQAANKVQVYSPTIPNYPRMRLDRTCDM